MGVVLGITGGVATGKTTVAGMFRSLGAVTLSADEVAREVLAPGSPAVAEVIERFGQAVAAPGGGIDRSALADTVFGDEEALRDLNAITHPRIISILKERIEEFRRKSREGEVLAVEIPLLIECNLQRLVDYVVVVAAEQETQMSRLTTRGLSLEQARRRIEAQMPVREKLQYADWVVSTDAGLDDTARQVEQIWEQVGKPRNRTQ
ncbi:MAG: dephospho-CoA kinase [Armatimonadetes bacterium]|nr:dephospho-CoA kinase [Armatimonadota bacterium]